MKALRLTILCLLLLMIADCQVLINPEPNIIVLQGTNFIPNGIGVYDFGNVYVDSNDSTVGFIIKNNENSISLSPQS